MISRRKLKYLKYPNSPKSTHRLRTTHALRPHLEAVLVIHCAMQKSDVATNSRRKEKQSAALIIEIDGKQRNINDTRQQMLPERHVNNQETDKKEEKQSAAEKYRSIVMVGQYIAKFVE